jgi:hypothetical protein
VSPKAVLPASKALWRTSVLIEYEDGKRWTESKLMDLRNAKSLADDFMRDGHEVRVEEDRKAVDAHFAELAAARERRKPGS